MCRSQVLLDVEMSTQESGADKRDVAKVQDEVSHATAKLPGYSASGAGAVVKDDPQRSEGSWQQTVGSGKEFVGGLVGAEGLRQEGIEQNRAGKAQEAQGQLNDFSSGVSDRLKGTVGSAAASFTGDRDEQARYDELHAKGKTQQRGAEYDIQKQNPQ